MTITQPGPSPDDLPPEGKEFVDGEVTTMPTVVVPDALAFGRPGAAAPSLIRTLPTAKRPP